MPIDTIHERSSVLGVAALPLPIGTIGQAARQDLLGLYAGLLASGAAPFAGAPLALYAVPRLGTLAAPARQTALFARPRRAHLRMEQNHG